MYGMDLVNAIREERSDPPSGILTLGLDQTHRWITALDPGRVSFEWTVDEAHLNLEGAVICPWIVALADQALFFASNTLCADGESTRMADLHVRCIASITGGVAAIDAVVERRVGDRFACRCDFRQAGELVAQAVATIDVVRTSG